MPHLWGANNKTGKGSLKIVGKGIYSGTVTVNFQIKAKALDSKDEQDLIVDRVTYDYYIDKLIKANLRRPEYAANEKLEEVAYDTAENAFTVTIAKGQDEWKIEEAAKVLFNQQNTPDNREDIELELEQLRKEAMENLGDDMKSAEKIDLEIAPAIGILADKGQKKTINNPGQYIREDKTNEEYFNKLREEYQSLAEEMLKKYEEEYGLKTVGDLRGIKLTATATISYEEKESVNLEYTIEIK